MSDRANEACLRWSSLETMKFIENYKRHQCLWDPKHPDYKNREAREAALTSLTRTMDMRGFDVKAAKRKIHTLRSTYWNEMTKISNSIKMNGGKKPYRPKLPWFPLASEFLSQIFEYNNTEKKEKLKRQRRVSASSDVYVECAVATADVRDPQIEMLDFQSASRVHRRKKSKPNPITDDGSEGSSKDENEFTIFGRSVGKQLRQLPLEDAIELQMRIQNMLTMRRLKVVKARNNSSSPTLPDEDEFCDSEN